MSEQEIAGPYSKLIVISKRVTAQDVVAAVADYYDLTVKDLVSQRRHHRVARPRQVAMYMCRQVTDKSYPQIGTAMGTRDHTTVIYGVRAVAARVETCSATCQAVIELEKRLKPREQFSPYVSPVWVDENGVLPIFPLGK